MPSNRFGHLTPYSPYRIVPLQLTSDARCWQALRPDVESTADSTLRHCFREPAEVSCATGRSYLPDATHEDDAIFTEPLWRRPCQASVGDNPFATSYEYADSVWNLMNALSVIAERRGGVSQLRELLDDFHFANEQTGAKFSTRGGYLWAADACVLIFGALYPRDHRIAQPVVPECYAKAHGWLNYATNPKHYSDDLKGDMLDEPLYYCVPGWGKEGEGKRLYEEALALWTPFSSRSGRPSHLCPWCVGVAPMLELLLKHKGSHELTHEDRAELRERVNTLASRAAWLAYSEDGIKPPAAPHPLAECATPEDVRRPHLDPIFCAQGEALEIEPRGCLVGLKPFQLRQLYALLVGSHLLPRGPGVLTHPGVQVVRNEGALNGDLRTLDAHTRTPCPVCRRPAAARERAAHHPRARRHEALVQGRELHADRERPAGVRHAQSEDLRREPADGGMGRKRAYTRAALLCASRANVARVARRGRVWRPVVVAHLP